MQRAVQIAGKHHFTCAAARQVGQREGIAGRLPVRLTPDPNEPVLLSGGVGGDIAGPRLGHIHFADSNRHAIGFGHTDIAPVVHALRETGYAGYISGEDLPLPDGDTAAKQTIASFQRWFH